MGNCLPPKFPKISFPLTPSTKMHQPIGTDGELPRRTLVVAQHNISWARTCSEIFNQRRWYRTLPSDCSNGSNQPAQHDYSTSLCKGTVHTTAVRVRAAPTGAGCMRGSTPPLVARHSTQWCVRWAGHALRGQTHKQRDQTHRQARR